MEETKKMKVLIADDEDGLRMSMAGIIEMEGHDVVTAENGLKAIEEVKKQSFDIAFLDIKMPGINGVDTFREIKKYSPETVVIMMTAFAVKDLIKDAIKEGAYACISKPFDMDKIMETIKEVSRKPFAMVVDDDPALCSTLNEKLKEEGLNVFTKCSGMEGLEALSRKIPDIMFIDLGKNRNGLETYKKLKEMFGDKAPKVVMMNSTPPESTAQELKQLGVSEYIKKPLNAEELKNALQSLLTHQKKGKILVVDDDKNLALLLKDVLATSGYDVDTAHSGEEVLKKMQGDAFGIAILDIRLPDINGLEVYEKIKQINKDMGVIFISGFSQDEHIDEVIRKNKYIYLHKPFEPENLIKLIEQIQASKSGK
ncbi:MAG: response regulator [Endomicrobiales bacterium]|nr:response regulator [Endomicrobiales bacterium]